MRDRATIRHVDHDLTEPRASVEIVLRFDEASDPIRGRLREPGGDEHEFAGWLGLVTALDQALQACSVPSAAASRPSPRSPRR